MPDRRQAFENLNARTNLPGNPGRREHVAADRPVRHAAGAVAARARGRIREARITRAEEKAARLPAMMTVPMILFILPTLFIVLMGPAAIGIIDTFSGKAKQQDVTVVEHSNSGDTDAGPESEM